MTVFAQERLGLDSDTISLTFLESATLEAFDPSRQREYDQRIYQAEAATNQFRYAFAVASGMPSGQEFRVASEHPSLAHHGNHHTRHFEKALKVVSGEVINANPDIFEGEFGDKLLKAMMLTVHIHDADQLASEYRNLSLSKEDRLKVKRGHAMAAAVQVLALTDLYSESTGISMDEARQITGLAAVMMMRHDEPGTVSQAFSETNRDASDIKDQNELLREYQSDHLNLSTLSPAQMISILQQIKGEAGFIGQNGSSYGLSPIFEQDFIQILNGMETDLNPILQLDPVQGQKLKAGTEMVVWADLVDMVSPYWDAIFRTFQGDYSKRRPFSWSHEGDDANKPPDIEELFTHVLDPKNGNGTVNDVERLLWELYNLNSFTHGTVLEDINFIQEFNREHAVMGAIALREVAQAMLNGANIDDIVNAIYINRKKRLADAASQKGISLDDIRFTGMDRNLDQEALSMIEILQSKNQTHIDSRDYQYFQLIFHEFIAKLMSKYGVTKEEFEMYDLGVQSGESAPTQLYMFTPDLIQKSHTTLTVLDPEKFAKSVH